jgi:hypothetical protein
VSAAVLALYVIFVLNKSLVTGEFLHNKKHGRGVLRYPSGGEYAGVWREDVRFGKGVFTLPKGKKPTEDWEYDNSVVKVTVFGY